MARLGTLLVALALLVVAWPARAQVKGAPRLVFSTPPGCGDEATFRHMVAFFFNDGDPFDPNAAGVVRVAFTKIPGGYRGTVQYTPPNGAPWPTQEKIGSLCALIFQPVARLASMHVPDPPPKDATPPEPAPTTPEPVEKPPDPIPFKSPSSWAPPPMAPENLRGADPSPPPGHKVDLAIGLSGFVLMSAGYTANVGLGFQLGAELRSTQDESDIFRMGLELRGLVPGIAYARDRLDPTVMDTIPQELDVSQLSAQLVPCVRWKYLLGCGVAQLSRRRGTPYRSLNRRGARSRASAGSRLRIPAPSKATSVRRPRPKASRCAYISRATIPCSPARTITPIGAWCTPDALTRAPARRARAAKHWAIARR